MIGDLSLVTWAAVGLGAARATGSNAASAATAAMAKAEASNRRFKIVPSMKMRGHRYQPPIGQKSGKLVVYPRRRAPYRASLVQLRPGKKQWVIFRLPH